MKILAFSDWRVQDIEHFLNYLELLEEKPDVILYAGDDIRRFNYIPYKEWPKDLKNKYRERIKSRRESLGNLSKKAIEDIILNHENRYESKENKFEKIARFSQHGLLVVAGNDDYPFYKKAICGKNVVDVHDNSVIIGNYEIVGIEGSTGDIGPLRYTEQEIKDHLDKKLRQAGTRKLIIISHSPPHGILDFAMRHEHAHLGSSSLKEFIEEYSDRIQLVVSGHVHRQGGESTPFHNTTVVNCASHDNWGAPGKIALIDISENVIDIAWKILYELQEIPYVGPQTELKLKEYGITQVEQLARLRPTNQVYNKYSTIQQNTLYLAINFAKAISSKKPIIKKGFSSVFDGHEEKNLYFFDAEYDPESTKGGRYGMFLLGWMDIKGKVHQEFLENPRNEKKMLIKFSQWVEAENPTLIAYRSTTADAPHLKNSFSRFKLPFSHIKDSFFDLYRDVLYTQSAHKQKIFLPMGIPCGLKEVSEYFGYTKPDLEISEGILAPIEYDKFLDSTDESCKAEIKCNLLLYNKDDLKRTKFIYEWLTNIEKTSS